MSDYEKIFFESIDEEGVHFEVEEDPNLIEFDEKLNARDIVLMCRGIAEKIFEKRSEMEQFARERGFTTRYDISQYCFVFEKEMPWNE